MHRLRVPTSVVLKVSPVEVEQVLGEMDGIEDAAVAGIPHESFGEVPMAFVVRASGSSVTEEEVVLDFPVIASTV